MTTKTKRGRPIGGKHPEVIRNYWRVTKAASRKLQKTRQELKV